MQSSVEKQVQRLYSAGYTSEIVRNVSETVLQMLYAKGKEGNKHGGKQTRLGFLVIILRHHHLRGDITT